MSKIFKYELKQKVKNVVENKEGVIVGRYEYDTTAYGYDEDDDTVLSFRCKYCVYYDCDNDIDYAEWVNEGDLTSV